jgi:hypothetical protein
MVRTRQGSQDLPRIRVSSRISKAGIQRQKIRRLPPSSVRHNVHRSLHWRRNARALTITLILHLIAAFFLIQSIRQPSVEEVVIFGLSGWSTDHLTGGRNTLQLQSDMTYAGGSLPLTDDSLQNTPIESTDRNISLELRLLSYWIAILSLIWAIGHTKAMLSLKRFL